MIDTVGSALICSVDAGGAPDPDSSSWFNNCTAHAYTKLQLSERQTELRFYVPLDTERVISETFPRANLLAWYGKTKRNTTKAHIHQSKEMYCNTKQTPKN